MTELLNADRDLDSTAAAAAAAAAAATNTTTTTTSIVRQPISLFLRAQSLKPP